MAPVLQTGWLPGNSAFCCLPGFTSAEITQGDWPWHPNRGWDDPKSRWHNVKGRSLSIVAFGDGHAAAFKFPTLRDSDPFWTRPPDPAAEWW